MKAKISEKNVTGLTAVFAVPKLLIPPVFICCPGRQARQLPLLFFYTHSVRPALKPEGHRTTLRGLRAGAGITAGTPPGVPAVIP